MALLTGFRPRSQAERMLLATALHEAPLRVGLDHVDDGWAAAHLWLWGRIPVWMGHGPREGIDRVLAGLGLPALQSGPADGLLDSDLILRTDTPRASASLPAPQGDVPVVTVLICTYNRRELLGETLDSVAAQSWPYELIVVDDGSTDGTWDLLSQLPTGKALRQPENRGKTAALNRGISEAAGEFLLVLDDDDLIVPGALTLMASALLRHPEIDTVWTDALIADHPAMKPKEWRTALRLSASMNRLGVLQQVPATTGSVLIRTAALRAAGPFVAEMHQGEDMDMFLRLAHRGGAEGLPLATSIIRSHPGVRGPAAHAFLKQDAEEISQIGMEWIAPVFRQRWAEASPVSDRAEAHAWGLGLDLRASPDEATAELTRWAPPYSPREVWIRKKVGLDCEDPPRPASAVVVVDDGDPGSLELTLEKHAAEGELWVALEVPREPLDNVRLYWPGRYGARKSLAADWVDHPGPWLLRLSSDPDWAPPPLASEQRKLLADIPAVDALLLLAAALDWPLPEASRARLGRPAHPLGVVALRVRLAIAQGHAPEALGQLASHLEQNPEVLSLWKLAADAFRAAGVESEALSCEARLQ
jgi:hypothetical protein